MRTEQHGQACRNFHLSIQVADYLLDKICSGIGQAMKKETSAKGKIFAYLDFNKTPLNTYITGGCPIFNLAAESDDNHGMIKSNVCSVLAASQKTIANILRAGIGNDEFNAALDPEAYAFKMFATIELPGQAPAIKRINLTVREKEVLSAVVNGEL